MNAKKSKEFKVLKGTFRPDKERPVLSAPAGDVIPPPGLPADALLIWGELATDARAMGALSACDVAAFAEMCVLIANLREMWSGPDAAPAAHIGLADRLLWRFGLAGAGSRAGLIGVLQPKPKNEFADYGKLPG